LAALVLALARLADRTHDGVTLAQVVLLHLAERDVHVVRTRQVAARAHKGVVVEHIQDAAHGDEHVIVAQFGLEVVAAAATLAVTVATAAAALLLLVILLVTTAVALLVTAA